MDLKILIFAKFRSFTRNPSVLISGDTLFAISDLMKKQKEELEEEMDEIIGEKFEKLNEKMNDKSIRPLKIEVKGDFSEWVITGELR